MTKWQEILLLYNKRIDSSQQKLAIVKRKIYVVSMTRILVFIACIIGLKICWEDGIWVLSAILLVMVPLFLALVRYHSRLFSQKEYIEKEIEVNKQEINSLGYDYSSFDCGKEFINVSHAFSFDLDVFGQHSLFQSFNRTCTVMGKKMLANWIQYPLQQPEAIRVRQEAIKELTPLLDFRQQFRITGLLSEQAPEKQVLLDWAYSTFSCSTHKLYRYLPFLVTLLNCCLLVSVLLSWIPFALWGSIWVGFVILSVGFSSKINKEQAVYEHALTTLRAYAQLLALVEQQPVHSELLTQIKGTLVTDKYSASVAIHHLNRLMHTLDQRNNLLISTLLNGTFLWNLWQTQRIEAWKMKFQHQIATWLDAIEQIDALNSCATFAYNHPDYHYPEVAGGDFCLKATGLGHPLMRREACVKNPITIASSPFFIIITGANMAGKSTYLRTVGVNYLLACVGLPVCAETMSFTPANLITSLRTADSLANNESYFFAELKRLKLIIDKLKAGEKLFIILDEILKGTNSADKQKGSLALITQFLKLNTVGIIATHDLLLGKLSESFPDEIRNFCFEADIKHDELTFTYRMREGVAQNMNACLLMKNMGITIE